jgi:hypothetical protein
MATKRPSSLCPEWYEPNAPTAAKTHTCDREDGHDERHRCPVCGFEWESVYLDEKGS